MQIFVRNLVGRVFTLVVDLNEHLDKVKAQIKEREGIPEEHQRLVYAGKQLEDGRPLTDYGITKDCTLNLVMRLPGGY